MLEPWIIEQIRRREEEERRRNERPQLEIPLRDERWKHPSDEGEEKDKDEDDSGERGGIDAATDAAEALRGFRAELQRVFGDRRVAEVASLLGGFLGFDMPESPLSRALAGRPEQAAELARAVLGRFLEQDALGEPL